MSSTTFLNRGESTMTEARFQQLQEKYDFTDGFLEPWEVRELLAEVRYLREHQISLLFTVEEPEYAEVNFPGEFLTQYVATNSPRYLLELHYQNVVLNFRALHHEGVAYTHAIQDH